jgi:oxalate decarboxylase/phosphoglucose isomerase-like protein (cupin superfamily)
MVRVQPGCNLDTIKDGRGAIFSYIPNHPIVEWTHQFIKAGKLRGNHCHPEFDEYILLVSGNGVEVAKNPDGTETRIDMSKGTCIFIPKGTYHVFLSITDCESVSFLTKKWDDCTQPIVHTNMGYGAGDHGDPSSPYYKK